MEFQILILGKFRTIVLEIQQLMTSKNCANNDDNWNYFIVGYILYIIILL